MEAEMRNLRSEDFQNRFDTVLTPPLTRPLPPPNTLTHPQPPPNPPPSNPFL